MERFHICGADSFPRARLRQLSNNYPGKGGPPLGIALREHLLSYFRRRRSTLSVTVNNGCRVANHALLCPALALLACFSCSRLTKTQPEKLFADAFRVRRTLELRLPGVPYAPLVQTQNAS